MKRFEFEYLAQAVLDGNCEESDFARLEEALRNSPEMRRIYRDTFLLDGMLDLEASDAESPGTVPVIPINRLLRNERQRALKTSLSVAAAVLLLAALALHLIMVKPPPPMAHIRLAPNTQLTLHAKDGATKPPGNRTLVKGDVVELTAGTVELGFSNDVSGIIQGPARLELTDGKNVTMEYGSARFEVPEKAVGFRIRTPRTDVVDLGTVFGIIAHRESDILPEVHVFKGSVQVMARDAARETRILHQGESVEVEIAGRLKLIKQDSNRFLAELPLDLPYVRFTFEPTPLAGTEVLGTSPQVPELATNLESPEPSFVPGVIGRAAHFDGNNGAIATNWQGVLGGNSRTITAWIRQPKNLPFRRYQTIVGWGDPVIGYAGKCELLLHQPAPGAPTLPRLSFDQFLFTGTTDLADGEWHHLAAVFHGPESNGNGTMASLYVDGVRESLHPHLTEQPLDQSAPKTRSGGRSVMIGLLPQADMMRGFRGDIDEVMIFEAALDGERIRALAEK